MLREEAEADCGWGVVFEGVEEGGEELLVGVALQFGANFWHGFFGYDDLCEVLNDIEDELMVLWEGGGKLIGESFTELIWLVDGGEFFEDELDSLVVIVGDG